MPKIDPDAYRIVLEKVAAGRLGAVRSGARWAGRALKKQFSGKAWREAGGAAVDIVKKPVATFRSGVKDYKTPIGALGLAAAAYEGYDIAKDRAGPSRSERAAVEKGLGSGTGKAYADLARRRASAEKGHAGSRIGGLLGVEAGGLAAVSRRLPLLPAAVLTIGSAIVGQAVGAGVDRLRGKRPATSEETRRTIARHEAVRRYARSRMAARKAR